jgi:hypothetical protein
MKAPGQSVRSIDGSDNNLADPNVNQTDTDFARVGPPPNFADGVDAMQPSPNPREISNIVVARICLRKSILERECGLEEAPCDGARPSPCKRFRDAGRIVLCRTAA